MIRFKFYLNSFEIVTLALLSNNMQTIIDKIFFLSAELILTLQNFRTVRKYVKLHGSRPRIANPSSYMERMLWRKLVDHNPQFVVFSDKITTKNYQQGICPTLAIPRILWVGQDADEIPDELLTGDVYVKTNHGWDFNYQIRGGRVDRSDLKKKTDLWLKSVHGREYHEWAYLQVKPQLFVEESIGDPAVDLLDINIRACDGKVILGSVIGYNKLPERWVAYLDTDGKPSHGVDDEDGTPIREIPHGIDISEPYQAAVNFTKKLSIGVDYARFDFMWNGSVLYGGEITVYPGAGNGKIINSAVNRSVMGGWNLEVSHFLSTRNKGFKRLYAAALKRQLKRNRQ
jgi:hypothetical protein